MILKSLQSAHSPAPTTWTVLSSARQKLTTKKMLTNKNRRWETPLIEFAVPFSLVKLVLSDLSQKSVVIYIMMMIARGKGPPTPKLKGHHMRLGPSELDLCPGKTFLKHK